MAQRRSGTPPTAHNGTNGNGHKPVETQAEMIVRVLEDANRIGLDRWVALAEGAAGGAASAGGGVYSANQRGGIQGWGASSWPTAGSGAYAGVTPSSQDANPKPIPEMEEISPDKPSLLNYAVTGTSFFGSIIQSDEYNPEFGWRSAVLKYEEMRRNDGQVRAIERMVTLPLLSAKWSIKPASDDPMDQEIASFVESCLFHDMVYESQGGTRLTQTWHDILRHVLLCVSFGFAPMEKCFRIEDGWVKWSKWQPLLPRSVWRWWVDRDNTLDGIQQWAYKDYTYQFTNIPRGKLLLFSFGQEGDNYEGVSMFRSTWKHWYYKTNFEKLVAIGVERNGVIPPIINVGPTASPGDVAQALKLMANLRTNEAMGAVLPHDWKLEYPRIYQNHAEATLPLMQYYDILMARSMLCQFINLGSSETGSYSLDKNEVQTFLMVEQSIADYVASIITNDAICQLVDYNYSGVGVYPELQCARLTAQNLASLADLMPALQLYLPPSPELTDYFSDMLGLPVPQQSVVENTNPTEEGAPGQQGQGKQGGAQGKMSPEQAAGVKGGGGSANAGSEDDTTPDYESPGSGDSSYSEPYDEDSEALLFREALLAAYGHDAVDRGVTWQFTGGHAPGYSQQRDAHGRFAPTGNSGSGSGGGEGGAAPHGMRSGAAGGRSRGAQAQRGQQQRPARGQRTGRGAQRETAQEAAQRELEAARTFHARVTWHRQQMENRAMRAAGEAHAAKARADTAPAKAEGQLRKQAIQEARASNPEGYREHLAAQRNLRGAQREMDATHAELEHGLNELRRIGDESDAQGLARAEDHPEHQAVWNRYMASAYRLDRAYDTRSAAETAAKEAEGKLVGGRVTPQAIANHPTVLRANERARQAQSKWEGAISKADEARQIEREAAFRVQRAQGLSAVAAGGKGVDIQYGRTPEIQQQTQEAMRHVFGRDLTENELVGLSGAQMGDTLGVTGFKYGDNRTDAGMHFDVSGGQYTRSFEVALDRQGNIIVHDTYAGNEGEHTAASGRDIVRGMENMRSVGVARVTCEAARGHGMNGYYTWAKLGFTGKIPDHILPAARAQFGAHISRVEQIMSRGPVAQRWWKEHGDGFAASFSFRPGSYSMRVFSRLRARMEQHTAGSEE